MTKPLIVSLCDYTGNWSRPYEEAGYEVLRVDIQHGQDARTLEIPSRPVLGVLAAPPCTVFSVAGAHTWGKRPPCDLLEALSVVDACVRFAYACRPAFWALENPKGRLRKWMGEPSFWFRPAEFGDESSKLTYLWGNFAHPERVQPGARGVPGLIENAGGGRKVRRDLRSATPEGFARAFFLANGGAL